jgi:hypothetical protein
MRQHQRVEPNPLMARLFPDSLCRVCGGAIMDGRRKRYCCDACGHEGANRMRAAKAKRPVPTPTACERCGETFQPKRAGAKYCSIRCRVAAHRSRAADATG